MIKAKIGMRIFVGAYIRGGAYSGGKKCHRLGGVVRKRAKSSKIPMKMKKLSKNVCDLVYLDPLPQTMIVWPKIPKNGGIYIFLHERMPISIFMPPPIYSLSKCYILSLFIQPSPIIEYRRVFVFGVYQISDFLIPSD